MNRNTIIAFALILGVFFFFQTDLYYNLRGIPNPNKKVTQTVVRDSAAVAQTQTVREDSSIAPTAIATVSRDTLTKVAQEPIVPVAPDTSAGDTVWVETDRLQVGIAEQGARIVSIRMREYTYKRGKKGLATSEKIDLIPPGSSEGGASLKVDREDLSKTRFVHEGLRNVTANGTDTVRVLFTGSTTLGTSLSKEFVFTNGSYVVGLHVKSNALAGRNVTFGWPCGIDESEWRSGDKNIAYDPRKAHLYDGTDIEHIHMSKPGDEERSGRYQWVGITSKYFLIALLNEKERDVDVSVKAFADTVSVSLNKKEIGNHSFSATTTADGFELGYRIYAGPSKWGDLRAEQVKLEKVLYGGWRWFLFADKWFPWICELLLLLLIGSFKVVRDYGVSIVILTILVKVVTYPLTLSSMKSMSRMRDLQPKVNALRAKHKADPRKMNEEMMALYKKEGVNPMNFGCLPMFLQMPILISLYVVLRKAIELRGTGTWVVPWVHDLSQAEMLFRLPFEIPFYGDNFALMPIVMAVVTFIQNKMTIKDPNQIAMIYLMPAIMLVMFNSFPAGLVLYWTLSSALGLVQQKVIDRTMQSQSSAAVAGPVVDTGKSERIRGAKKK